MPPNNGEVEEEGCRASPAVGRQSAVCEGGQAYIAATPDWKRDVGRRLDALVVRTVPHVCKANARSAHLHENDPLDEELLTRWINQASGLPGDEVF